MFFKSKRTYNILIEDLISVKLSTSLFFATMRFEIQGYEQNPAPIRYLSKQEAIKAHRLITGLITCKRNNINLKKMSFEEINKKVYQIGKH